MREGNRMATDAGTANDKLKALRGKLPKTVQPYLQKDYSGFTLRVDALMDDLKKLDDGGQSAKDRADYATKKQDLAKLKDKINDAAKKQKALVSSLQGKAPDINKAATVLINILKDKKAKDEVELLKAVMGFAQGAQQQTGNLEAPDPVD
jgi:hypothetical protein